MKIWLVGRAYPNSNNNYNGSFEFDQAKMLSKMGHDVSYFCVETVPFYKKKGKKGTHIFQDGAITIFENYFPYQPLPPGIMVKLRDTTLLRMMKACAAEKALPDIIHVHYPALMGARFVCHYKKQGVRVFATEHWTKVLSDRLNLIYKRTLILYRQHADGLIAVGKPLKDRIDSLTGEDKSNCPTYVIPNIVPVSFQYADAPSVQPFRFIAIGRLVPCKRFNLLIQAFEKVFRTAENVELTIVGGGPEYDALIKLIEDKGLSGKVFLIGSRPHDDIHALIHNAHVLVCSSNLETFGVPVIEAMACGRPVITTDAIGFTDLMDDSVGIVIKTDSLEELSAALKDIYRCYQKYDGLAISEYALSKFSEDAVYAELMRIYGDHQSQDNIV